MSKKDLDFDKLSSLKPKKIKARADPEKAIESIHNKSPEKEKVKRITIDLPFSLYVDIRKKTIEEEMTLKDYFVNISNKDIEK
ncbi:MAG: hypothetical protein GYB31_01825 [Bacteroidetes bacterium]|nr:hypothetical protein [Bacteroidota bacterium]